MRVSKASGYSIMSDGITMTPSHQSAKLSLQDAKNILHFSSRGPLQSMPRKNVIINIIQIKFTKTKLSCPLHTPTIQLQFLILQTLVCASKMNWILIWLALSLCFYLVSCSLEKYTTDSLDAALQDFALKTLVRHRPHTGALYKAMLPANLSGMKVSIVRLRSRRLWNIGANFSNFHIPARTLTVPHVRRMVIVYQDFGNWSTHFYSVPGYSMITPVTGFMVFDASNVRAKRITKLSLNTTGKPIVIRFSSSTFSDGMVSRARCATFSSNGTLQLSKMSLPNVCYSQDQGHFTIVVPLKKKPGHWYFWVVGFVLGFGVLVLVGYLGVVSLKLLKTKKIQVMEKQADEDLVLDTIWVGRSKMPSATVTRTQPVLEDGGFP